MQILIMFRYFDEFGDTLAAGLLMDNVINQGRRAAKTPGASTPVLSLTKIVPYKSF